jgi:hypothetical protein
MNSDQQSRLARRSIETIQRMLDPAVLAQMIDEPIDRALRDFRFAWPETSGIGQFHQTIGRFMHHMVRCLSVTGLSVNRCVEDAVGLLEANYPGDCGNGHENALQELADPPPQSPFGIDHILLALAEILKAKLREQFTAYIWARYVDCLPAAVRRHMARLLLQDASVQSCPSLRGLHEFELADHIRELFEGVLDARGVARRVVTDGA